MGPKSDDVLTSLRAISRSGWLFKCSELNGIICIVAMNPQFNYSNIRFFDDERKAQLHVDYLCLVTEQENENSRRSGISGQAPTSS